MQYGNVGKKVCYAAAIICLLLIVNSCGGGSVTPETLTLVPSSFDIIVNTQTGTVTGATQIAAFLNKTPVDLSAITWTTSSATVSPSCFGVDQTGVPHCNPGCGSTYAGVIKATITDTAITGTGTSATATINCQYQ